MVFGPRSPGRSFDHRLPKRPPAWLTGSTTRSSSASAGGLFCPSMLDTVAPQMIKVDHPVPFMTFTFEVSEEWKTRVPKWSMKMVFPNKAKREYNPRYYDMMKELEVLTGNGVSLNTSLNRRGEAMICSPTDALNMFFGSDLQYPDQRKTSSGRMTAWTP